MNPVAHPALAHGRSGATLLVSSLALLLLCACGPADGPESGPAQRQEAGTAQSPAAARPQTPTVLLTLSGVTGQETEPLGGAAVRLLPVGGGSAKPFEAATDAAGRCAIGTATSGAWTLDVRAPEYLGRTRRVFARKQPQEIALKLQALVTLTGSVTTAAGEPIPCASVRLVGGRRSPEGTRAIGFPPPTRILKLLDSYHPETREALPRELRVETDETGTFLLPDMPPYVKAALVVSHPDLGQETVDVPEIPAGDLWECAVRLKGVTGVKGTIPSPPGGPYEARVDLYYVYNERWLGERKLDVSPGEAFLVRDILPGYKAFAFELNADGVWYGGRQELQVASNTLVDLGTLKVGEGLITVNVRAPGYGKDQAFTADGMLVKPGKNGPMPFAVSRKGEGPILIHGLPAGDLRLVLFPSKARQGRIFPVPGQPTVVEQRRYDGGSLTLDLELKKPG